MTIYREIAKSIERKIGSIPNFNSVQDELIKYRNMINSIDIINIIPTDCCICFDEKSDCITNCKHQFHKSCITTWIRTNASCPLCRHTNIKIFDIINE